MNYAISGFYVDSDSAWKESLVNTMKALLAAGADVNAKDNNGWTPLLRLARNINGPVDPNLDYTVGMEFLLAVGADVNAKTNTGWTPLHMAARYGHEGSINVLVAACADVNAVNNNRELLLDIAIQHNLDGYNIRRILTLLTPKSVSPAEPGEPMEEPIVRTSSLTIERIGERTKIRWRGGVLQFSPEANGQWRDVILNQGFFRLKPQSEWSVAGVVASDLDTVEKSAGIRNAFWPFEPRGKRSSFLESSVIEWASVCVR